jgi:hypothetical protein
MAAVVDEWRHELALFNEEVVVRTDDYHNIYSIYMQCVSRLVLT